MTKEKLNQLFQTKNLVEVLGTTLMGIEMLIEEIPHDTQLEFSTEGASGDLRSLSIAKELVRKKLIQSINI